MDLRNIDLKELSVGKTNVRNAKDIGDLTSLKASIKEHGLIQPLVVVKNGKGYNVIAGQRRLKAIKEMRKEAGAKGKCPIECVVSDADEEEQKHISLAENFARKQLDPIAEADAFKLLLKKDETYDSIADLYGVTERYVRQRVVLSLAPQLVRHAVKDGVISPAVGGLISHLDKPSREEACSEFTYNETTDEWSVPHWASSHERAQSVWFNVDVPLSMALFDIADYKGSIDRDLFALEDESYFADMEEFYTLQIAAVEKMAEASKAAGWGFAKIFKPDEYSFYKWEWNHDEKAKPSEERGVIYDMGRSGKVSIFTGMKPKTKQSSNTMQLEGSSTEPPKKKQSELAKYVMSRFYWARNNALRAAVFRNETVALQVLAVQLLTSWGGMQLVIAEPFGFERDDDTAHDHLRKQVTEIRTLLKIEAIHEEGEDWLSELRGLSIHGHRDDAVFAYKAIKKLKKRDLMRLIRLLSALGVGVSSAYWDMEPSDQAGFKFFELLGKELKVDANDSYRGFEADISKLGNRKTVLALLDEEDSPHAKLKELKADLSAIVKANGAPKLRWLQFPWKGYLKTDK